MDINTEIVYSDDYIKVEIDEHIKYVYLEWLQTPDTETFRRLFKFAATIAFEHKCEYWLSDARNIPFLDFADQNWVLRDMAPFLLSSSLKKYARLTTKQSIGMLDMHRISSHLPAEVESQLESFSNKEAALDWLFSDYTSSSSLDQLN